MEEAWLKSKINLRVIITHIGTKFGGVKSLISKFPYEHTDGHVPQLLILFRNIYVIVYGVCHGFFFLLNKFSVGSEVLPFYSWLACIKINIAKNF